MKFQPEHLHNFLFVIDVECPKCVAHAVVTSDPERIEPPRFSCLRCGFTKTWGGNQSIVATGSLKLMDGVVHLGQSADPWFGFVLWYQIPCCGRTLWAYNKRHLWFYEDYIGDKLRERTPGEHGWSNQSLQSRLPKWMLPAGNRKAILKKIRQLREE